VIAALLLASSWLTSAFAHGNHHHQQMEAVLPASVSQQINEAYLQKVRPIFLRKCFDCHSDRTLYPVYYSIPGVKQLIDSDVREGREHLDFSKDYPFVSHAMPVEDLDAIGKAIEERQMPPTAYRLVHPRSVVTLEERRIVFDWIDEAKHLLQSSAGSFAAPMLPKKN
jgi:uncharacterized membrane protein